MAWNGIKKEDAFLVVIDIQERLIPAMSEGQMVREQAAKLIKGCGLLGIPALTSQQYTKGLGETLEDVRAAYGSFSYIEKSAFSVMGEAAFRDAVAALPPGTSGAARKTALLCGVETHVCVMQSALDFLGLGYSVFLLADAVSSRKAIDADTAVRRMAHSGVLLTTVESVLFELLDNDSKSDTFKAISKLIK
jgi:nicotinamidase-related amidase